jgi:hypothetical protein
MSEKFENLTKEQLDNIIWYDGQNGNHYFTFVEDELIGVKDRNQKNSHTAYLSKNL